MLGRMRHQIERDFQESFQHTMQGLKSLREPFLDLIHDFCNSSTCLGCLTAARLPACRLCVSSLAWMGLSQTNTRTYVSLT